LQKAPAKTAGAIFYGFGEHILFWNFTNHFFATFQPRPIDAFAIVARWSRKNETGKRLALGTL
jgi:hypothetical protein